jgi:hypothetical protein
LVQRPANKVVPGFSRSTFYHHPIVGLCNHVAPAKGNVQNGSGQMVSGKQEVAPSAQYQRNGVIQCFIGNGVHQFGFGMHFYNLVRNAAEPKGVEGL